MRFLRIMERLEKQKEAKQIKREHHGQRYDEKLGVWVDRPKPIRKYQDRKIERKNKKKGA